jgi:hypothetical protein
MQCLNRSGECRHRRDSGSITNQTPKAGPLIGPAFFCLKNILTLRITDIVNDHRAIAKPQILYPALIPPYIDKDN